MAIKTVNDIPSDIKSFVERYYSGETSLALDQARQLRLEKNDIADLVDIATDILQSPPDSLFSFYDSFINRASNVDMLLNMSGFSFDDMDEPSLSELSEAVPEKLDVSSATNGDDHLFGSDFDFDEALDFSFPGVKSNQSGGEEARDPMEDSLSGCRKDRKALNLMGNSIDLNIDLDESFGDLNSSRGPMRENDPNQYSGLIRRSNLPDDVSSSICHAGTPSQPLAALYAVAAEADMPEESAEPMNLRKSGEWGSISNGRFGAGSGQHRRLSTVSSFKTGNAEEPLIPNEPYSLRTPISSAAVPLMFADSSTPAPAEPVDPAAIMSEPQVPGVFTKKSFSLSQEDATPAPATSENLFSKGRVDETPTNIPTPFSMNKPVERIQSGSSGPFSRSTEERSSSKLGNGGHQHLHFDKRGSGMFSIDAVAQEDMSLAGSIRHSRSIRESLTENERPTMSRLHAVGGEEHERPTAMSLKPVIRSKFEEVPSADVTVAPPKKQRTRTPTMETDELSTLHPLSRTPRLCISLQDLSKRTDVDARAGFILSLIDGTVTISDILSISSWSQTETASILLNLKSQNILDFD